MKWTDENTERYLSKIAREQYDFFREVTPGFPTVPAAEWSFTSRDQHLTSRAVARWALIQKQRRKS